MYKIKIQKGNEPIINLDETPFDESTVTLNDYRVVSFDGDFTPETIARLWEHSQNLRDFLQGYHRLITLEERGGLTANNLHELIVKDKVSIDDLVAFPVAVHADFKNEFSPETEDTIAKIHEITTKIDNFTVLTNGIVVEIIKAELI